MKNKLRMKTKEIVLIAIIIAIYYVVFSSFSIIPYVELLTLTITLFSMFFNKRIIIFSSIGFCTVNLLVHGIYIWSLGYFLIYPLYSLILHIQREKMKKRARSIPILIGMIAFLQGPIMVLE